MKRIFCVLALSVLPVALLTPPASAAPKQTTWSITIENLTGNRETGPRGSAADGHLGQPLSPPLAMVHSQKVDLFTVGKPASSAIELIAEDGNPFPGASQYQGTAGVLSSRVITNPTSTDPFEQPIWPGESRTFTVTSSANENKLSLAMMLGFTNDAFTGLDAVTLRPATLTTVAYDAGTEVNTELRRDVAQGGNFGVGPAEGGVIHPHPGLADVPDTFFPSAKWGWTDPVSRITITRVR